ncbi:MAG: insulinase family protein, partial [Deltaproteobacteria bacterium]|nr:insulinase family protein [Deltaproteobacteria bacterium]
MRHLFSLLIAAILFVSPNVLHAQASSGQESRSTLAALASKVKFYTLPNGLRVILYRRGDAPVFGAAVGVRVGGTDEQVGRTGISHMFEHMAFKGTDTVGTKDYAREQKLLAELETLVAQRGPDGKLASTQQARWDEIMKELNTLWNRSQFVSELEKRGASDLNATTDKEMTRYFMNLPRSAFEFWCWMESERLLHPVMREFYQELEVVKEEKRMRYDDDPSGKLYETLLGVAYLSHPYRNPVIGYDADLRNLTATAVDQFRRTYYVPGNMAIAVVGDVNPESDIKIIEKYFGRLPSAPLPPRPDVVEGPQEGERSFTLQANASPQIFIAYHKPQYPHADDAPITLMLEILAGKKTSPLYTELVKKKRLVTDIGHDEAPGAAYPNLFVFYASARSPHTNAEVLAAFDDVIKKFTSSKVSEEDLEVAKRAVAMDHLSHLKSNLALAQDFVTSELLSNNWKAMLD